MKNDLARGFVVPIEYAAKDLADRCAIIRTRLRAIPSEFAPLLHECKSPMALEARLLAFIDEALTDLAAHRP